MPWGKKKGGDQPAPRKCRHVDVQTWTTEHKGPVRTITVKWSRCRDCGETWNEVT